jgi:lysophospholipase L1-like esterase
MKTLAKAGVALLLPWIVLELGLRIAGYHAPDNRSRTLLFPRFPAFYEPDRDLAWKLRPNVAWQARDFVEPFTTDGEGHRSTPQPGESVDAPRVDFIGDSSTFGYGSLDASTFPAVLARLAAEAGAPVRVRNLGVPGYNAQSARLIAESVDEPADVTLVMVGFNDHFPANRSAAEDLWIRRAAYACFASRVCALLFDHLAEPRAAKQTPPTEYRPAVSPDEYREQLGETVRALRERGSEPILLVYPSILSDEKTRAAVASYWKHPRALVDANVEAHPRYQQITREVAAAEDVRLVDLAEIFEAAGNESLHIDWVHPNDAGYRLIAQSILPELQAALAEKAAPSRD